MQLLVMVDSSRDVESFVEGVGDLHPKVCRDEEWIDAVFEEGVPLHGATLFVVDAESAEAIDARCAEVDTQYTIVASRPTPSYPA